MDNGGDTIMSQAARYRACQAAGSFPGVTGGDDCAPLDIPPWEVAEGKVPGQTMEVSEL